jgi:hypothetical protein
MNMVRSAICLHCLERNFAVCIAAIALVANLLDFSALGLFDFLVNKWGPRRAPGASNHRDGGIEAALQLAG